MENKANLLFWEDQGYLEANLTKIVEFLGGTANPVRLTTEMVDHPEALKVALPIRGCLIISARALAKLGGDQRVSKRRELLAASQRMFWCTVSSRHRTIAGCFRN